MLSWSFFNQYSAQYFFQATGCFPTYLSLKQWTAVQERNESWHNDKQQSSDRNLAKLDFRTSNLLFFFPVINPSQQNPNFQQPCRILPTTWCEKEKILVTSIFSFHTIFSALSKTNFVILGNVYFVVCRCFKLFSKILLFDKELKYMIVS